MNVVVHRLHTTDQCSDALADGRTARGNGGKINEGSNGGEEGVGLDRDRSRITEGVCSVCTDSG